MGNRVVCVEEYFMCRIYCTTRSISVPRRPLLCELLLLSRYILKYVYIYVDMSLISHYIMIVSLSDN